MSVTPKRHVDWSQTLVASALYVKADDGSTFPSTPIRLPDAGAYAFFLNVTVAITDVGDTLDLYIQTTLDGGTTYVDVGRFAQVVGNVVEGAASQHYLKMSGAATTSGFVASTALATTNVRNIMGDLWRIRTDIAETNDAGFTFSVHVIPMVA